jgi:hypothetical protein
MSTEQLSAPHPGQPVTMTINGKTYTYPEASITIGALVALAGVPTEYHRIAELGDAEQTDYLDLATVIALRDGSKFETIRVWLYLVDTDRQVSTVDHLTVREILVNAGIDPADHYLLELRGKEQIEYKDLDQVLTLHEAEQFISVYHGPTPVS